MSAPATKPRLLIVSEPATVEATQRLVGEIYRVIDLQHAYSNEGRREIDESHVLIWPAATVQGLQSAKSLALEIACDAAEVKFIDTGMAGGDFMGADRFNAMGEGAFGAFREFALGDVDGTPRTQVIPNPSKITTAAAQAPPAGSPSQAIPPELPVMPVAAATLLPVENAEAVTPGEVMDDASEDSQPAYLSEVPPPDDYAPAGAEIIDFSDIQSGEYQRPNWVSKDPDEDWGDPVDLWGGNAVPPVRPDALPPAIAPFVFDQSRVIGTDPVQLALNCLVVAASCIRHGIYVQMQKGPQGADGEDLGRVWKEHPILWGAVVGLASTGKGPAFDAATHRFRSKANELISKDEMAWVAYGHKAKVYDNAMQQYYREAAKKQSIEMPEEPQKPPRERLWTDDATLQAVAKTYAENPRGKIAIFKDELAGWFGSFDAFSNGKDQDRPAYLSFYESKERPIDRVGGGFYLVKSWSGCILGGIQPMVLGKIADKLGADGMLQRFMIVHARDAIDGDDSGNYDISAVRRWHNIVDNLLAMEPRGNPTVLSPEAQSFMSTKLKWAKEAMKSGGDDGLVSSIGKYPGLFGRLMITAQCIDDADRGQHVPSAEIGLPIAEQCWRWIEHVVYPHGNNFYNVTMGQSPMHSLAKHFGNFVLARGLIEVNASTLAQKWTRLRRAKLTIAQRREFWSLLETLGWVRATGGKERIGALPTKYAVNPHAFDGRFALQARMAQSERERALKYAPPEFLNQIGNRDQA